MHQDRFHAFIGGEVVEKRKARGKYKQLSAAQRAELWMRWRAGQTAAAISVALAHPLQSVRAVLLARGGIAPAPRTRSASVLSATDREEISRGLAGQESARAIAQRLSRAPSTISRLSIPMGNGSFAGSQMSGGG